MVFYAPWAGSYELLNGFLQLLHAKVPTMQIVRINIEEEPEIAKLMDIKEVPATALFRHHKMVDMFTGVVSRKKLVAKLYPHI